MTHATRNCEKTMMSSMHGQVGHAADVTQEDTMKTDRAKKEERFVATVKQVRPEGVYVEKHGMWSGSISAKCWGDGEERTSAMSKIRAGDKLCVQVVSRNADNKYMSLVLAPRENGVTTSAMKTNASHPKMRAKKQEFVPLPAGTQLLIDLPNLIGELEADHCAEWMRAIESSRLNSGYGVKFFTEERSMRWAIDHQRTRKEERDLKDICECKNLVTIIHGDKEEADLAIMQTASVIPNSVCVSCDKYRDYAKAYPNIVGTQRVRPFTTSTIFGNKMLHITGILDPIVLPGQMASHTQNAVAGKPNCAKQAAAALFNAPAGQTRGLPKRNDDISDGELPTSIDTLSGENIREKIVCDYRKETSIRLGALLAKKNPEGFFALADIYAHGDESEMKLSSIYDALGVRMEKRQREIKSRERRLHAQMQRLGTRAGFHLSAKRRREMEIADLFVGHAEVKRYLRSRDNLKKIA